MPNGRLYLCGAGLDQVLQCRLFDYRYGWRGWDNWGGVLTSAPTVASGDYYNYEVAARGTWSTGGVLSAWVMEIGFETDTVYYWRNWFSMGATSPAHPR